jgi:hypothetical protein
MGKLTEREIERMVNRKMRKMLISRVAEWVGCDSPLTWKTVAKIYRRLAAYYQVDIEAHRSLVTRMAVQQDRRDLLIAEAREKAVELAQMVIVAQRACDNVYGNESTEGDNIHEAAAVIEEWGTK